MIETLWVSAALNLLGAAAATALTLSALRATILQGRRWIWNAILYGGPVLAYAYLIKRSWRHREVSPRTAAHDIAVHTVRLMAFLFCCLAALLLWVRAWQAMPMSAADPVGTLVRNLHQAMLMLPILLGTWVAYMIAAIGASVIWIRRRAPRETSLNSVTTANTRGLDEKNTLQA